MWYNGIYGAPSEPIVVGPTEGEVQRVLAYRHYLCARSTESTLGCLQQMWQRASRHAAAVIETR